MKEKSANSAHQPWIENYFQSTSSIRSARYSETFAKSLLGLLR